VSKTKTTSKRRSFLEYMDYTGVSFGTPFESIILNDRMYLDEVSTVTYGDNIPNYRDVIARGDNATTSLSGSYTKLLSYKEGKIVCEYKAHWPGTSFVNLGHVYGFGTIGPFSLVISESVPTSTSTANNRALARWNAKAAGVNRQFQGGVFFAELHKTLHGIAHPAEALFQGIERYSNAATKLRRSFVKNRAAYNSLTASRRRSVSKAFSTAASGLWLEQSFHWLPLYYDIQGAINALAATWDSWPSVSVKVSAFDEQSHVRLQSSHLSGIASWITCVDTVSGVSVRLYGKVRVRPRLPWRPDMAALGFDFASFVPTLWELVPYSWAVDYFTNIGDIIYGCSQGGTDVAWTSRSQKRLVKKSFTSTGDASYKAVASPPFVLDYSYISSLPSEVVIEKAIFDRTPQIDTYIPSLDWRVPGLSLKWLNVGAAFLQRSMAFL